MKAFADTYERESAITARVLRAYPEDKLDFRPHEMSKSARELAWLFVMEQGMLETALTKGFDWSKPMPRAPEPPATMREIADALEGGQRRVVELVRDTPEDRLPESVSFFTAPRQLGNIPTRNFLWFMLHDQIHHRGQFSIYLRMAGGRVPSIYGPTADEPWT
ncbi:MAG TPA: DinB family protein [Gemmatimonadaceae bacterium]|nr:DinB family protein [Gemmatimonadaceae bacterium]